jgi:exonuclease III
MESSGSAQLNTENKKSFKLMTYNVFENKIFPEIKKNTETCKKLKDFINEMENEDKPDIICTQEEPKNNIQLNDYDRLNICPKDGNTYGNVAVYYKKEMSNPPTFEKCIVEGEHKKNAIIFNYNNIKIANLHLYGGRYADADLKDQYNEVLKNKLKLLTTVIENNPDIILGDFNSVYSSNKEQLERFLNGQYEYFEKTHGFIEQDKIKEWNSKPYEELIKNFYSYAKPDNEIDNFTNFRGETIVDTIWYKNNIKCTNTNIINTYDQTNKCAPSDHNPVITTINISSPPITNSVKLNIITNPSANPVVKNSKDKIFYDLKKIICELKGTHSTGGYIRIKTKKKKTIKKQKKTKKNKKIK